MVAAIRQGGLQEIRCQIPGKGGTESHNAKELQ